ncbi:MAG: dipicolinate synthase subunit DpsA [bacterium]
MLKGRKIAVIGGDLREKELIRRLLGAGAEVTAVGSPFREIPHALKVVNCLEAAFRGAEVIIAPVLGADENGLLKASFLDEPLVLTPEIIAEIPSGVLFLIGTANASLRAAAQESGFDLVEIAKLEEFACRNAVPTAEGAVQLALENLPFTINEAEMLVLGFGRVGRALSKLLSAMGARVTVAARAESQRQEAESLGCESLNLLLLADKIGRYRAVFNTIPALVLDKMRLSGLAPGSLIIDLASFPGGTDFAEASKLKLKAVLASGLPGKTAPESAGKILSEVVFKILQADGSLLGGA